MRIDKFLSTTNVVKTRTIAVDMINSGVVSLNGSTAKAHKIVKINDLITINYLQRTLNYRVLAIPQTKSIKKSDKDLYIKLCD